jgi:signal peptidase I
MRRDDGAFDAVPAVAPTVTSDADAASGSSPRARIARRRSRRWVWRWAARFQLAAVVLLLARAVAIEAYKIPSTSMQGTLLAGDFLLVNKLAFGASVPFTSWRTPALSSPRPGEVVVFAWPPAPGVSFVKRVAGVAGDTLAMVRSVLIRNGQPVHESYLRSAIREHDGREPVALPWSGADVFAWQRSHLTVAQRFYFPSRDDWGPLVVPPGHLFVLGDNRDNSLDSRYWGFVPDSLLRGTPLAVYYSYRPDSAATAPWVTRIRWSRIGRRVE